MTHSLIECPEVIHYLNTDGKWEEIKGSTYCTLENNDTTYNDSILTDMSHSFTFRMSKKQWYCFRKSVGLIKPVYKKKRKGKRYVWYEVI